MIILWKNHKNTNTQNRSTGGFNQSNCNSSNHGRWKYL